MRSVEFVDEPFTVTIRDGFALLSWQDGRGYSVPIRVFRINCDRANKALADYDARKADVVPIGRKKRS